MSIAVIPSTSHGVDEEEARKQSNHVLSASPTSYFASPGSRRMHAVDYSHTGVSAATPQAQRPWDYNSRMRHPSTDHNAAASSRHAPAAQTDLSARQAGPSSQVHVSSTPLVPAFRYRDEDHRGFAMNAPHSQVAGPSRFQPEYFATTKLTRAETQPLFQTSSAASMDDCEDVGAAYPRDIRRPSAPGILPPQRSTALKPPSSSSGSSGGGTWSSKQAAGETPSTSLDEGLPGWQVSMDNRRQPADARAQREMTRGETEMLQALKIERDAEIAQADGGINVGNLVRKTGSSVRRASADFKLKFAGMVSPTSASSGTSKPHTPGRKRESGSVDLGAPSARWQRQDAWVPPWIRSHDGQESGSAWREGPFEKPHPSWWSPSRTPSPSTSHSGKRLSALSARISSPKLQSTLHEEEGANIMSSKTNSRHRLSRSEVHGLQQDRHLHAAEHLFEFAPDPQASPGPLGSAGRRASRALRNIKSLSGGALRRASMTSLNSSAGIMSPTTEAGNSTIVINTEEDSAACASPDGDGRALLVPEAGRRDGAESRTPRAERQLLPAVTHEDDRRGATPTGLANAPAPSSDAARKAPVAHEDNASVLARTLTTQASQPEPQSQPERGRGGPLGPAAAIWRRVQREASAATQDKGLAPIEQRQKPNLAGEGAKYVLPSRATAAAAGVPREVSTTAGGGSGNAGQPYSNGARSVEQGRPSTGNAGNGAGTSPWGSGPGGGSNNAGGAGGRPPPGGGGGNGLSRSQSPPVHAIFKRQELVGRGAYGAVYRGVHLSSGTAVALKVVNLDTPEDDVSDIQREVALLSQLKETESKNVIKYWGCWLKGPELWIVMDFAEGGSVRTVMKAGNVAEKYCGIIMRESLVALAYLHKAGIIHRDIKAANILLTNTGRVMLCDFGVAATLVSSSVHSKRSTFVGTPYWMAPEVITEGKTYDQSADIWSLGITLYEMACGNPPHADQEQMRAIMLIPKSKPPRLPNDGQFSSPMREFLAACLNEEPKERPNADELAKMKWTKSFAKTSTAVLKDLIANYNAWTKTGGMRMSLLGAETADLSDHGHRDSFAFDGQDGSDDWEFGTFRGTPSQVFGSSGDLATRGPVRDHPLLRLFDSEDGTPAVETIPANSPVVPANMLESLSRARAADSSPSVSTLRAAAAAHRPAPPPPQAASTAWGKANPTRDAPESLSESAAGQSPVDAVTAADQKASFAGTGITPFRFGGGGAAAATKLSGPTATLDARRRREQQGSTSSVDEGASDPAKIVGPRNAMAKPGSGGSATAEHRKVPSLAHEKRPSVASVVHRRGKSSLSSMSTKSNTTPIEQDASQSNTAATSTSGLSMSPAKNRNGFVLPSGSHEAAFVTPFTARKDSDASSSNHAPHPLERSQSDQQVPIYVGSGLSTSHAPQDAIMRARSADPDAERHVPASAPVGQGMEAAIGTNVERTPAQAATAALISAQRYAAQTPNYGSRSRSGSRTRPLALTGDGASLSFGQAHSYGRSFSAASSAATFREALGAGHEFATEGLPPSPSPSSSAFFAHLNGQPSAGLGNSPYSARTVPNWGGQNLRQHAESTPTPTSYPQHSHSRSLHNRSQHGGSDALEARQAGFGNVAGASLHGPKLNPLDLAAITRSGASTVETGAGHLAEGSNVLHVEISRIVQDLGDWLEVLGNGLADIVHQDDAAATVDAN